MQDIYDVAIIGSGIAGTFAAFKIAEKYNDIKTVLIDVGRPPGKRRRACEGFFGCFPTGDGKIYPGDLDKIKNLVDGRKATPAFNWVMKWFGEVNAMKMIKDSKPNAATRKKITEMGFQIKYNDYFQWKPSSVHSLAKIISEKLEDSNNVHFKFDTEVFTIKNQNNQFEVETNAGKIFSKKVLLCVGRSGWRWVTNLYDTLGIVSNDDFAKFGVKIEVSSGCLSHFNNSHLSIYNDDFEVGPFCWNGTIIQEDHSDLVISAFRSNEDRWKSDKVSFSLLKKVYYNSMGSVQADRIGKLTFLLFNDRVSKEKIKIFLKGKSQLNLIPEYNWLATEFLKLDNLIPNLCRKGNFHVPDISPEPAEIKINNNLETEIEGLYVAGEAAKVKGIMSAAMLGVIAADSACK